MLSGWRIVKARHLHGAFSGEGSRRFGGRWNSVGVAMVYTAGSMSLAALEMVVHLETDELLESYWAVKASFDEELVAELDRSQLPPDWRADVPPASTRELGDEWVRSEKSVVLRVPSVIIESECNYLFNPRHSAFSRVRLTAPQPFTFDARLRKR